MILLTQHINFKVASSRVSSLIVSHVANVISAPHQSLPGSMSVLLLDSYDADVIGEMWLVPTDDRRSILGNYPKIAWTTSHFGRNLIDLELLTFITTITEWTHTLPAMRRHDSLDTTRGFVISRPRQH